MGKMFLIFAVQQILLKHKYAISLQLSIAIAIGGANVGREAEGRGFCGNVCLPQTASYLHIKSCPLGQ